MSQTDKENKAESSKQSETSKKPLTTKSGGEFNSWLNLTGVNRYSYTGFSSDPLRQFVMRESCIVNDQQALLVHQDHTTNIESESNAKDFFIEPQIEFPLNNLENHSFNGWSPAFHYINENPNLINPVIVNYNSETTNESHFH